MNQEELLFSGLPPGKEENDGVREYYVHGLEDMRTLLQRAGAALGVAATALLAGLGYAQLHNLFPLPSTEPAHWTVIGVAIACTVFAAVGSVWLASRFFGAQRRILITPSIVVDEPPEDWRPWRRRTFTKREHRLVKRVYKRYVARYAPSTDPEEANLERVQNRAYRLRDSGEEDLAERLDAVVGIAQLDAVTKVLGDRSNRAFRGWGSGLALTLALGGIIGLFAVADYSKSKRSTSDQETAQLNQTKLQNASIRVNTALACSKLPTNVTAPKVCR
jgi:hypothetical protein